jgi:hypothetical protein
LQKLHADYLEKFKTLIKDTQKEIQDNMFKPRKYTDSRGLKMFSLFLFYDYNSKSIQIYKQVIWKIVKSCTSDKESIPRKQSRMMLQHDAQSSLIFLK